MKFDASRAALAAIATLVVVTLLTLALASNDRTRGYYPRSLQHAHDDRYDRFKVDVTQDEERVFKIEIPSFQTRVRATLHMGPVDDETPAEVLVYHRIGTETVERIDALESSSALGGPQSALEVTAVIFALFGLFVLWWGRDRASLWLGLFCASFAPSIFDHYGVLPELGMLLASFVADLLFFLSIYAFFQIALTFALDALRPDNPLRGRIENARELTLAIVAFSAAANFVGNIGPTVFGEPVWPLLVDAGDLARVAAIAITLGIGPIVLLAIGYLRAADAGARARVRITLITTLVAQSGVLSAMWQQIASGRTIRFDDAWFTLLAIPFGYLFSIKAYKVVEVKFVINRILVLTTMTVLIASAIVLSQTLFENIMPDMVNRAFGVREEDVTTLVRFVVALAIVLTFNRCHFVLDEFFKALFFRRRDAAVRALHDFASDRAHFITSRSELLRQAIEIACKSVGANGAAFYEESGGAYALASTCGTIAWPASAGENDPAFTLLRSGRARVDLGGLDATPSVLGETGLAIRMAVSTRVLVGALAVGPRVKESDGPYEREELEALEEMARSVSEALFNLRANETAEFIRNVADGSMRGNAAVARAEEICERGLPGVDTSPRPHRAIDPLPTPLWPPVTAGE